MPDEDIQIGVELYKVSKLLEESIQLYREDRKMALENYIALKEKLEELWEAGIPMSEEGALEREVNKALKLSMESAVRLEKAIEVLSKISIANMNNMTKLQVADKLVDGQSKLTAPVDFKQLTSR